MYAAGVNAHLKIVYHVPSAGIILYRFYGYNLSLSFRSTPMNYAAKIEEI
jgi:hypothetical protein